MNLDDAYLTLYGGQDYADAIKTVLRIADPKALTDLSPTGRTIPRIIYREQERNWLWEAAELAQAAGMRLKKEQGVWLLFPCKGPGTWEFNE